MGAQACMKMCSVPVLLGCLLCVAISSLSAGCGTHAANNCTEHADCKDPGRPFCDKRGIYPESNGVFRVCIATPQDLPTGSDCRDVPDGCESGYCVKGVCCISACNGVCKGGTCSDACTTHEDCVEASVCDRSEAHTAEDGAGICAAPETIVATVSDATALYDALNAAADYDGVGVPIIRVTPRDAGDGYAQITADHMKKLQNSSLNHSVKLIATGKATTIAPNDGYDGSLVDVMGNVTLVLQGFMIVGAKGRRLDQHGIYCHDDQGSIPTLKVVECSVEDNATVGVYADGCNAEIRRSRIVGNAGGLFLRGAAHSVTNSLIAKNGGDDWLSFGGVYVLEGIVSFVNNTIVGNKARAEFTGGAGGIACSNIGVIENSIVWGNSTNDAEDNSQYSDCTFSHSVVEELETPLTNGNQTDDPQLDEDYRPSHGSNCVNKGDNTAAGGLTLDYAGNARLQDGRVDIGAYETTALAE